MSEGREYTGPGWIATLLGGFVLIVLGFGLGLVVGAAREEPELVLRHFSGESKEVPAPAPEASPPPAPPTSSPSGESSPQAALPPPPRPLAEPAPTPPPANAGQESGKPASTESVRPAAPVSPPPVSSAPPAPGQHFSVQVGAFAESSEAERLADRLRRKGMHVFVLPATGPRDARWRVRVGPIASRDEANRLAEQLKTSDKLPTWVLAEGR